MTAFPKVIKYLRQKGGKDILVVGGGIIPDSDKSRLEKMGIKGNFGPGTSLKTIIDFISANLKNRKGSRSRAIRKK